MRTVGEKDNLWIVINVINWCGGIEVKERRPGRPAIVRRTSSEKIRGQVMPWIDALDDLQQRLLGIYILLHGKLQGSFVDAE